MSSAMPWLTTHPPAASRAPPPSLPWPRCRPLQRRWTRAAAGPPPSPSHRCRACRGAGPASLRRLAHAPARPQLHPPVVQALAELGPDSTRLFLEALAVVRPAAVACPRAVLSRCSVDPAQNKPPPSRPPSQAADSLDIQLPVCLFPISCVYVAPYVVSHVCGVTLYAALAKV